jgi:dipeptidase
LSSSVTIDMSQVGWNVLQQLQPDSCARPTACVYSSYSIYNRRCELSVMQVSVVLRETYRGVDAGSQGAHTCFSSTDSGLKNWSAVLASVGQCRG